MRTKKEILDDTKITKDNFYTKVDISSLQLEVLLDIRQIVAKHYCSATRFSQEMVKIAYE